MGESSHNGTSNANAGEAPDRGGWAELDERLYKLDDADVQFLLDATGLETPAELKEHILGIQAEAYAVHPYPCIRGFTFAQLKISQFPVYGELLRLGRDRPGALFLDVGCGSGIDVRKAVADGFPVGQVVATDLHAAFWEIGHRLCKSTPETFPVKFLAGDVLDPAHLRAPPGGAPDSPAPPLSVPALASLTPLRARLSAIFVYAVFHVFAEDDQERLAVRLASLLSAQPGSMMFGAQCGMPAKGTRVETMSPSAPPRPIFCHSPASWAALWTAVFGVGRVEVKAELRELPPDVIGFQPAAGLPYWYMYWSVIRL
ncbi:hypothetical protein PHLGIDRAFT_104156 [Phlebiopsis gigantea 11061_1 CR5-6]|uniref:Methyltransferase domain-containing protein n=1 Tax=Phlebiopsis gigantea (strain 11061_1 CR5-6) TaxID=745531 RepID=A0A0C3SC48_PHLG1|nr:hypothetical protein PHLGIDRAFT_104156 [Phlebiopsis gigantea 11061_1 CR5-6]